MLYVEFEISWSLKNVTVITFWVKKNLKRSDPLQKNIFLSRQFIELEFVYPKFVIWAIIV